MADDSETAVDENEDGGVRVAVSFPFDRMTVQRFRQEFPRACWSDRRKAWIVPEKTARRRIDRWLAREESPADPYAEAKGRDAYAFEPILSPYLSVDKEGFRIRTPIRASWSRKFARCQWRAGTAILRLGGCRSRPTTIFASTDSRSKRRRSTANRRSGASAPRRAKEQTRKCEQGAGQPSVSAGAFPCRPRICLLPSVRLPPARSALS